MDRSRVDGSAMGLEGLERWIGEEFGQWTRALDRSRVDGSFTGLVEFAFGQWTRAMDQSRVDGSQQMGSKDWGQVREQISCDGSK